MNNKNSPPFQGGVPRSGEVVALKVVLPRNKKLIKTQNSKLKTIKQCN